MAGILAAQAVQLLEALTKLEGKQGHRAPPPAVHELEHKADGLSRAAIGRLFKGGNDPLEVIKLRDIYRSLEDTIDAAEDAAEVIERILAKSLSARGLAAGGIIGAAPATPRQAAQVPPVESRPPAVEPAATAA